MAPRAPLAAALAALCVSLAHGIEPLLPDEAPVRTSRPAYILEYDAGSRLRTKRDETFLAQDIQVVTQFESAIFTGAQVTTDNHALDELTSLPGVLRAWLDEEIPLLAPIVSPRQTPVGPDDASRHDVHWATGVDKLHGRGIFGKGVKIGIIDTGVWYNHSALGGGIGSGHKIAGGYDLVGKGWTPGNTPRPSDDPIDEQGHGTHVAGIVAGDAADSGWKGVAPEASLYSYKVFGSSGSTETSVVISGLLKAFEEGMDIITASLGGPSGYADNPLTLVANRIAGEGVVVTFAAGNSGSGGPFFADNGGAAELVLSVASADVYNETIELQPSSFTSWGGLYDLSVKPDIAAPGRDIYSTWIGEDDNSYNVISGTSMATPYVAGVAALYLSAKGLGGTRGQNLSKDVSMRIIASGDSINSASKAGGVDKTFKAPIFQVGNGLIDASKVIDATVSLGLQRFALNDTQHFQGHQEVMLQNNGNTSLNFTFEIESAASYEMLLLSDGTADSLEAPRVKIWQDLSPIKAEAALVTPDEFSLQPGEARKAAFEFSPPAGLNTTALPIYSGKVLVKASNGDSLSVPFQGLAFDLAKEMKSMFVGTYPLLRAGFPPKDASTFNFDASTAVQSYPKIFSKLKWGTRELRWDIYTQPFTEAQWSYPPVIGENGFIGSATSWSSAGKVSMFDPVKHNASDIFSFPLRDQTRNAAVTGSFTSTYFWFGKLGNGTMVAPGNYTVRFAALKPFSDPVESESWATLTRDITLTHSL